MIVLSVGIKLTDALDLMKLRDELSGGVDTGGVGWTTRDGEAIDLCC